MDSSESTDLLKPNGIHVRIVSCPLPNVEFIQCVFILPDFYGPESAKYRYGIPHQCNEASPGI